jgi:hypothetical protein
VFEASWSGLGRCRTRASDGPTEMVFDKRNTRPKERTATPFAAWDEERYDRT